MALDVESVGENLGTLIQLLDALGIDTSNSNEMDRVSKTLNKGDLDGLNTRNALNDDQIEIIIHKLQQAQAQAPGIIAALETVSAKNTRASTGKKKKKKPKAAPKNQKEKEKKKAKPKQQKPQPAPQPQVEEEEEEEEDYDDFDEDADYPCVGEGYSDEVSVMSEMTTPTVVSNLHVADEEKYQELNTPMKVIGTGGGPPMILQAPKRKNLVAQTATRAGGAAAARRRNYQEAMAKLHENPYGMTMVGPQEAPPVTSDQVPMNASNHQLPRRTKSSPKSMMTSTEVADDLGDWAAFEDAPATPSASNPKISRSKTPPNLSKMKASTVSSSSGFTLDAEFDAFASKESPFASLEDSAPSVASNKNKKKKSKAKKGLASEM